MNIPLQHIVDRIQVFILTDWRLAMQHKMMVFALLPVIIVPASILALQLVAPTPVQQEVYGATRVFMPVDISTAITSVATLVAALSSAIVLWRSGRIAKIEKKVDGAASVQTALVASLQTELTFVRAALTESKQTAKDLADKAAPMQQIPATIARIDEATATVAEVIREALHATPDPKG